jgi:tetratricopeptide (TPR) repeat protein
MEKTQRIIWLLIGCITSLSAQRIPQSYFNTPQLTSAYYSTIDSLKAKHRSNPDDLHTLEKLGDYYGANFQWDDALKVYAHLVTRDPNNFQFHFKHGGVLGVKALEVSRIQSVPFVRPMKVAFEKAAALNTAHIESRWVLMELYEALPFFLGGSDAKAQKMVDEIQQLSPLEGALAQGFLFYKQKRPEKSIEFYEKAFDWVSQKPCSSLSNYLHRNQSYYELGKALFFSKRFPEIAICCFSYFIEHHSSKEGFPLAFAHERLAQVYDQIGNIEQAKWHHQKAISQLPSVQKDLLKWDDFLDLEIVSSPKN